MVRWAYTLDIADEWRDARKGKLTVHELGSALADRLDGLNMRWSCRPIIDMFRALDESSTFDDFDDIMESLYNWGDDRKRLWVATI